MINKWIFGYPYSTETQSANSFSNLKKWGESHLLLPRASAATGQNWSALAMIYPSQAEVAIDHLKIVENCGPVIGSTPPLSSLHSWFSCGCSSLTEIVGFDPSPAYAFQIGLIENVQTPQIP